MRNRRISVTGSIVSLKNANCKSIHSMQGLRTRRTAGRRRLLSSHEHWEQMQSFWKHRLLCKSYARFAPCDACSTSSIPFSCHVSLPDPDHEPGRLVHSRQPRLPHTQSSSHVDSQSDAIHVLIHEIANQQITRSGIQRS